MSNIYIWLAVIFGIISVTISCAFLRPMSEQVTFGIIRAKNFKAASTYVQYQPGADRGFRTPNEIPIAEAYVFSIVLEGQSEPVNYSLNTVASEHFSVGQRVRVKYTEKSLGPFWRKIYVIDMFSLE